ncbi:MAG: hypothetical protein EXS31_09310 [Pedosphaera sp.]|nr:hypothetical protein [Pedosphaera sp.]
MGVLPSGCSSSRGKPADNTVITLERAIMADIVAAIIPSPMWRRLLRVRCRDSSFSSDTSHWLSRLLPNSKLKFLISLLRLLMALCAGAISVLFADAAPGDLDFSFTPAVGNAVASTAVQPDGKIVCAGWFNVVSGATRQYLARFNPDGTLDPGFDANVSISNGGAVLTTAIQADQKILIGGRFNAVGGTLRNSFARLKADGSLDSSFVPVPDGDISSMAIQVDGKIVIGGTFTNVSGTLHPHMARLNLDGAIDAAFNPVLDGDVSSIAFQADGRLIAGGIFTNVNGSVRTHIARLNADGTLDVAYNPTVDARVWSTAMQVDGKIVIGGIFTNVSGIAQSRLARLNTDGSLDAGFTPEVNNEIWSIVLQTDGKIIIGGRFTTIGGVVRNHIARLNPDGTLDINFDPNADQNVRSAALQADGKIILGGDFGTVGGVARNRIARLLNDAATNTLTVVAERIEWLRGGASPEAQAVTFELSTDGGAKWAPLGGGIRITGGWELGGLSLPASGLVRARARVTNGDWSSGIVEAVAAFPPGVLPPTITIQPQSQIAVVGANLTLSVAAAGAEPLKYQWRFQGISIPGETGSTLSFPYLQIENQGTFDVVISNPAGITRSAPADLTVQTLPGTCSEGFLLREVFNEIPGSALNTLTNDVRFPDFPDLVDLVSSFETPASSGENYGVRLSGYLHPPVTGDYTFYISAGGQSALHLSTDDTPAKKVRIATEPVSSSPRDWVGTTRRNPARPENRSVPVRLEAGRRYYIEALMKDGTGADHLAVTWRLPGAPQPVNGDPPIPGLYLEACAKQHLAAAITSPLDRAVFSGATDILISAGALSRSGNIVSMEFFAYGRKLGESSSAPFQFLWRNAPPGKHSLTVRATDSLGTTAVSSAVNITVYPKLGECEGLAVEYFRDTNLIASIASRIEPVVDFDWSSTSPDPLIGAGTPYSVRWTGFVQPRHSERYAFETRSDAGVRLWVNNQLLVDNFATHPVATNSGAIDLVANKRYPITVEYVEDSGDPAVIQLLWSSASQGREIIPSSRLANCLIPDPPPVITLQPGSRTHRAGAISAFSVVATGIEPLRYQWRFNDSNLAGETNSTLTLLDVQKIHQGAYSVVVSDSAGATTSNEAVLTVLARPTISKIPDQLTTRNRPTTSIPFTIGDAETPVDLLQLSTTSSNTKLVPETNVLLSGIGADWSVIVLPSSNQSGGATITIMVTDADGATAETSFNFTVGAPNSAPTLNAIPALAILEDSAGQTVNLTGITSGAANEIQVLTVTARSGNSALIANLAVSFSSPDSTGILSFKPVLDGNGQAFITVTVRDNGGTVSGGVDSTTRTFPITITPVNDPPSFTTGVDLTVNEDSGPHIVVGWATNIRAGPANEADQPLTFQLSSSNSALFSVQPTISPTGALNFTSALNANGSAIVTVQLKDSGGTENGGIDASLPQAFTINVKPVNHPPTLAPLSDQTVKEGAQLKFTASATDVDLPAQKLAFSLDPGAPPGAAINAASGEFTWTLTESQGPGSYTISVSVTDDGTPALSDSRRFQVIVEEVDNPPVLAAISDQTVKEGAQLKFTASATDVDLPAQKLAFNLDPGAPPGAAINGTSGEFTWTPTESQGPGNYTFSVSVTDDGTPALSDFRSFQVTVEEVNNAPVLATITDQTVKEGTQLKFTASATDVDLPAQKLAFSLDPGAPPGAAINAASGEFTWTSTESQGPGSYTITVRVTDDGTPALSDSRKFQVTVEEVNNAPALTAISDQTVKEGAQLKFTASATDIDLPEQKLAFSFDPGAPLGAAINVTSGEFTWTPTESQGPGSYTISVRVTDDGTSASSDSRRFQVTVEEVNSAPVLAAITDQTVKEGTQLKFTASAADIDLPAQKLAFNLDPGSPPGAAINATSGEFTWTSTESQGPGTYTITVRVTDDGTPALSDSRSFQLTVEEVNSAPVLAAITDQTVKEGTQLKFTASATDVDLPAQKLAFSLDPGTPLGAAINATSGEFTWTPTESHGPGSYTITVRVTDDGTSALSDSRSFQVTVTRLPELFVNSVSVREGDTGMTEAVFEVELRGVSSLPVTVHYTTADGTATAGNDYEPLSGQLEFPANAGGARPRIEIDRSGNAFRLRWTAAPKAFDLFETADLRSGEWSRSALPVIIQGSEHSAALPVSNETRFFGLASTTATTSETRRQLVRVFIKSDREIEPDENFFLRLGNPVNATIVQGSGEGVILNDDIELTNLPPQVRLTNPETDDSFPEGSNIVLAAEASDPDGTVKRVVFFANGQIVGSATQAPFTVLWLDVMPGNYTLNAAAIDDKGLAAESAPVQISVRTVPPGRKQIAIVQNFSASEISKLQAWLADLELDSHVFNQAGLTFEALQTYDLVIWDDLGTLTDGLSGNDVVIFQQIHNAGIPLYFIGNDLARATSTLPANAQSIWTGLMHLKPAGTEIAGELVTVSEQRHPVTNGPFGLAGGFKLLTDYDATVATGAGETVLARVGDADVLIAHEEPATSARTVTQNVLAFEGNGLTSGVQREKLFKNAVWWLLKRLPPPPFLNLRVVLTTPTEPPRVGQLYTLTAEVQHGGELEATGITLTVTLPDGWEFVSAASASGPCTFGEGVVVCRPGRLSRADSSRVSIAVRPTLAGAAALELNVSANQPEAVSGDNSVQHTVVVMP